MIRRNSFHAWFLASRPKTLTGAGIPVLIASALAWADGLFCLEPCLICFAFAFLMQIAANFINDLFDFLKGTDRGDRLGPERACAQGWISPMAMKTGIGVILALACALGLILLTYSNPLVLIGIGIACVIFAFLYTTMLSYCGMGDLLVLVFFGIVPVIGTYYVETQQLSWQALVAAFQCGILTDTLLVLNNYRDRDTDRKYGKKTLIAIFGEKFGRYFYLVLGITAWFLGAIYLQEDSWLPLLFTAIYLPRHIYTWKEMVNINHGKMLNRILGETSKNMLIFALLLALSFIIEK